MKIHLISWIFVYFLGIIVSWNNIYSARFMIIMWGLCVIIFSEAYNKYTLEKEGEKNE